MIVFIDIIRRCSRNQNFPPKKKMKTFLLCFLCLTTLSRTCRPFDIHRHTLHSWSPERSTRPRREAAAVRPTSPFGIGALAAAFARLQSSAHRCVPTAVIRIGRNTNTWGDLESPLQYNQNHAQGAPMLSKHCPDSFLRFSYLTQITQPSSLN